MKNNKSYLWQLLRYSIPILFSGVTFPLIANFCLIMLSTHETAIMASYAIVTSLQLVFVKSFDGLMVGIRVDSAENHQNTAALTPLLFNSIVLAIIGGILVGLIFLILPSVFDLLHIKVLDPLAFQLFLKSLSWGMPFLFLYINLCYFSEGIGMPHLNTVASWISTCFLLLSVVAIKKFDLFTDDYTWIPSLLSFSRLLMAIILLASLLRHFMVKWSFVLNSSLLSIRNLISFGLANSINYFSLTMSSFLVMIMVNSLGASIVASFQIQMNLLNLFILTLSSLSISAGVLLSQTSKEPQNIARIIKSSIFLICTLFSIFLIPFVVNLKWIVGFYSEEEIVIHIVGSCLMLFFTLLIMEALLSLLQSILIHLKDKKAPIIRIFMAWFVTVPIAFGWILKFSADIKNIFYAYIISAVLSIIVLSIRFIRRSGVKLIHFS